MPDGEDRRATGAGSPTDAQRGIKDRVGAGDSRSPAVLSESLGSLRVEVVITGHASPRWKSASNPKVALAKNKALSEKRAQAVREAIVRVVRRSFRKSKNIEFDISYLDPFAGLSSVTIGSESRGAGDALRSGASADADDLYYRRVDISLRIYHKRFVDAGRSVRRAVASATRYWAIALTSLVSGGYGGGIGRAEFMLKNREVDLTRNMKATLFGAHSPTLGGGGAANRGQEKWASFKTKDVVDWQDFNGTRVEIYHAGISFFVDIVSETRLSLPFFGVRRDITGWSTVSTPSVDAFVVGGTLEYQSSVVPVKFITVQESDWTYQVGTSASYLPIHFESGSATLTKNDVAALATFVSLARTELEEKTRANLAEADR